MKSYSPRVAIAVVIANMVGTGVFTSLGFQLAAIDSTTVILLLWAIGGLCAVCGAMCYAELGAHHPASGGEYHFLSALIHPFAGFLSGVVSATVGFAAPIALAALTFGVYLATAFPAIPAKLSATAVIVAMVLVHTQTRRESASGQFYLTLLKLMLIAAFIAAALISGPEFSAQINFEGWSSFDGIFSGAAAVSLIYVTYAYSGWNAATYILGELERPQETLPKVLVVGCATVMITYVVLHLVFLSSAPIDSLEGQVEIAFVVAEQIMGSAGAFVVSLLLAGILISTISAMVMAGPRALQRLGEDYPLFDYLGRRNKADIPVNAIVFMAGIALLFLWTSTFEQILLFAGVLMATNTFVTVAAVFVSRRRFPRTAFVMPWYPLPAIVFLSITGWTLAYSAIQFPQQLALVLIIVALAFPFHCRLTRR